MMNVPTDDANAEGAGPEDKDAAHGMCGLQGDANAGATGPDDRDISVRDFQQLIHRMYYDKDVRRGIDGTFMWLMEEIGELASALRTRDDMKNLAEEFADVIAWLTTIDNLAGIDLVAALRDKYGGGCPGCGRFECVCEMSQKP